MLSTVSVAALAAVVGGLLVAFAAPSSSQGFQHIKGCYDYGSTAPATALLTSQTLTVQACVNACPLPSYALLSGEPTHEFAIGYHRLSCYCVPSLTDKTATGCNLTCVDGESCGSDNHYWLSYDLRASAYQALSVPVTVPQPSTPPPAQGPPSATPNDGTPSGTPQTPSSVPQVASPSPSPSALDPPLGAAPTAGVVAFTALETVTVSGKPWTVTIVGATTFGFPINASTSQGLSTSTASPSPISNNAGGSAVDGGAYPSGTGGGLLQGTTVIAILCAVVVVFVVGVVAFVVARRRRKAASVAAGDGPVKAVAMPSAEV